MTQRALASIRDETLAVLRSHVAPGERVALLDFPSYDNAGDSLIYAGEIRYLEESNVQVDYVSDVHTHHDGLLRDRVGAGTIFLRGGGNFGDRWPGHQRFREGIVERFPHNKIVCLPQGIDYADPAALRRTADLYSKHSDLTLLLRERKSYDLAIAAFPDNRVEYCPDMAFGAQIDSSPGGSAVDVVKLLRVDSEGIDHGAVDLGASSVQADWGLRGPDRALWNAITLPTRIAYNVPRTTRILYPALARSYPFAAQLNLRVAQRILNQGSVVLTDRLHAAVLAAMMGKRVVALDNANKKVSGIYSAYLHRFDTVRLASTAAEAVEMVEDAVTRSR
ncbi:polysaccharide pyruvyl transferase family protein [Rhodococcoides fascians]|uniref:polysaccharide pyruvyl transferase family protein n=1 Tax=Rhodococcoides fascians TaxID=1828 RepID=UPI00035F4142|nr:MULTISPECIES: polysaccharide pyruvyl transferase family protein [Rhodococcus]OZC57385.1 hypothetical protein CH267_09075 [Rhodococcus sp. 06-621-2]OZE80784.1 hypothetical protein CH304_16270 [Rhodococcus sp. 15-649-1-2]